METLDSVQLNFNNQSLLILNICLAIIMFGVALDIKVADFIRLVREPRLTLIGLISQFIILPALSFLLVWILKPSPSIALGMILVAACPGGNISNFMSHLAGGNAALSVSLTAVSSVLSIFLTPFNLTLWGGLYSPASSIMQEISLNPLDIFKTIFLIIAIPLCLGMLLGHYQPIIARKMGSVLKPLSILIFAGFVAIAFLNNWTAFLENIHRVVLLVFLHNALGLASGYGWGSLWQLPLRDKKTLSIETGIQNSGLGLLLIFSFFNGLGGMAVVAGWWGIWHIISGMLLAFYWSKRS